MQKIRLSFEMHHYPINAFIASLHRILYNFSPSFEYNMIKCALLLGAIVFFPSCSQHQEKPIPQPASAAQTVPEKMDYPNSMAEKRLRISRHKKLISFGPRDPELDGPSKMP